MMREEEADKAFQKNNRMSGKRKVLIRRIFLIVVGVILGVNLYLANAKGIGGNQLPMPFGYGIANVLSGSMEPTFSKGTLLLVKETQDVQVGDIIVYQSGQELIVHRVIALNEQAGTVTTQGDANNAADPVFEKSQIKGKVLGWVPILGAIASILKTPTGILVILVLAFVLNEASYRRQRDVDDQELEDIKAEIRRLRAEHDVESSEEESEKEQE